MLKMHILRFEFQIALCSLADGEYYGDGRRGEVAQVEYKIPNYGSREKSRRDIFGGCTDIIINVEGVGG